VLERLISDWFRQNGWTWNLKDGGTVIPSDNDVEKALDEAARILYNEKPGTKLQVGRLIIEKRHVGHDVYVYYGEYY